MNRKQFLKTVGLSGISLPFLDLNTLATDGQSYKQLLLTVSIGDYHQAFNGSIRDVLIDSLAWVNSDSLINFCDRAYQNHIKGRQQLYYRILVDFIDQNLDEHEIKRETIKHVFAEEGKVFCDINVWRDIMLMYRYPDDSKEKERRLNTLRDDLIWTIKIHVRNAQRQHSVINNENNRKGKTLWE